LAQERNAVPPAARLIRPVHASRAFRRRARPAFPARGTVSYGTSSANGTSLGSQSPTEIVMIDNSGADKDSTSAISSGGGFSNTWLRAS
jgi:hypothetical protein